MGVDFSLEDVTLGNELIICRHKYVDAFLRIARERFPKSERIWLFDVQSSAYGSNEDLTKFDHSSLPKAGDLVSQFEALLAASKALETSLQSSLGELEQRALTIFSSEALEHWTDYCRANPESRMLASIW